MKGNSKKIHLHNILNTFNILLILYILFFIKINNL